MITTKDILNALPELEAIENPDWRKACLAVWAEAAGMSCWETLTDAPNNLETPEESLVQHTRSVYYGAFALAEVAQKLRKVEIDYDKLRVICLLHDVCKLVELERGECDYQKSRRSIDFPHGYFSCYLCMKHGLPEDIAAAVISHSQFIKNTPACVEGILQFYADMADADVCMFRHNSPLLIRYCKI